jgi:hypothetical protein
VEDCLIVPPAARLLIAGLVLPAVLLAGCDAADTTAAGPPTPTPTAKRQTPTPTASRPAPANTRSPSRTPTPAANTTEASKAPARTLATLREIRSVPDRVNPYDCTPPAPAPERPEVIADVALGGYRPAELIVTLEYNGDPVGGRYRGTARMQYDAARKVFTYRLPPVSRDTLPPHARSIGLNVRIDPAADGPPPHAGYVLVLGECVNLLNGSQ